MGYTLVSRAVPGVRPNDAIKGGQIIVIRNFTISANGVRDAVKKFGSGGVLSDMS